MQRVPIAKSIGLIGLVAASLLLCSAQSFPAPKLYRAKPEDLPSWSEQGNFRFLRLDGGQIESWKAERTCVLWPTDGVLETTQAIGVVTYAPIQSKPHFR